MGQENSHNSIQPQQEDVLTRQLSLYQWRSNRNFNSHIARTSFKNASIQQQQQLFEEFLSQQQEKDYLQLYKFKQKIRNINNFNNEPIVVFQQYHSSLKDFKAQLSFEESVYVLHGLLTGYEQIKKVFHSIVVDSSCCFITIEGNIRAWINPNYKINQVWHGQLKQLIGEHCQYEIIYQIVRMTQNSSNFSKQCNEFFSQLKEYFYHKKKVGCTFSQVRKWINEYCFLQRVHMSQSISLHKKNQVKSSKRSIKTQSRQIRNSYKQKSNVFKSTMESQTAKQDPTINIVRSKSIDQKMFPVNQNYLINYQLKDSVHKSSQKNIFQPFEVTMSSTIPTHKNNQQNLRPPANVPQRYSFAVQTQQNLVKTGKDSLLSHRECFKIECNRGDESKVTSSPLVTNQKIQEKEVNINIPRRQAKKSSIMKKRAPKGKSIMQVSLMNAIEEKKQLNHQKSEQKKFKTMYMSKDQISSDGPSETFSRPWITTKTLTKLVSEHSDSFSMKESITESSEYYNCSEYSGALTQLGRDITQKQEGQGKSKTLRVSRQFDL